MGSTGMQGQRITRSENYTIKGNRAEFDRFCDPEYSRSQAEVVMAHDATWNCPE